MKIAFLEDNVVFAEDITSALARAGHDVQHFVSGRECLKAFNNNAFDIGVLDWEVPEMSGAEVLTSLKLHGNATPIIFLTARDSEEDIVRMMEIGADDYIVKPPNIKVLLARINALYRRSSPHLNLVPVINYGHLVVDFNKRRFEIAGEIIKLTEKETELAIYFFGQVNVLLSRSHLTKVVWGTTPEIDTRTIDVHVSHLRSKLQLLPEHGWRLFSVYQQGYRLERLD